MVQKKKSVTTPRILKAKKKETLVKTMSAPEPEPGVVTTSYTNFPIVGIGASAGGLEALELFFSYVPPNSGMAFVVIQHMDPTYKGILVELLQRNTPMKVFQVSDRMRIEPNCVYVIPPNKDMSILHGFLHLMKQVKSRGLRLPIDHFLRSLAEDQQEHSIGVILSGMGMDGTLGLRSVKEKGGLVLVQSPDSAKFDSMPKSVIDAGLADVIAPAEELPDAINKYIHHAPLFVRPGQLDEDASKSSLEKALIILRAQTGHDFSLYKKTTVYRRIERRIGLHHMDNIATYVSFLRENPQEVETLFHELLIGVTNFFRDPAAWEVLKNEVLPTLLVERAPQQAMRAWIAGCSSGEEAYSLAIVFKEALDSLKLVHPHKDFSLLIFATDLHQDAIDKAREGRYPENISVDVSPERLKRFFTKTENGYQVSKTIREMVIFAPQNIIMDPPFTKLDILSCRNLMIYLTAELQKKLLPLFHYSLNKGGILFLGNSETIGTFNDLFAPVDGKARIYRRMESRLSAHSVEFPTTFESTRLGAGAKSQKSRVNIQDAAEQLLLQIYSPPAALTNQNGDILYISGRTGKYLEPAAGKANWNIFVMAREGLRYELTGAFQKALRENESVTLKNLVVSIDGGSQKVDVTIQPLTNVNDLHGMMMVVFNDVASPSNTKAGDKPPRAGAARARVIAELKQQIEYARNEMLDMREQMQASHEELRSANEELQSTNEELNTSKEEMQSMNEELQIINSELQAKVKELNHANSDMKNLLDSTDIATLFLDNELRVRRFTSATSKITNLIPGDVGRPITDIASALFYPSLTDDARKVLRTLAKVEKPISLPNGDWYATRIMPYRTLDNMIDGVVITFTDITASKKLEKQLRGKSRE